MKLLYFLMATLVAPAFAGDRGESCRYEPNEVLVVATTGQFEPWTYIENGELTGWDVDFLREVMHYVGAPYQLVQKTWGEGCCEVDSIGNSIPPNDRFAPFFGSIYNGTVDFGMSVVSNPMRRTRLFDTSNRYGFLSAFETFTLLKERESEFNFELPDLQTIAGHKIGVIKRGTNQDFFLQLVQREKNLEFEIIYAEDRKGEAESVVEALIRLLNDGEIDLIFGEAYSRNLPQFISKGDVKVLENTLFNAAFGSGAAYYFRPGIDRQLIDAIDCAVRKISTLDPWFYHILRARYGRGLCNPWYSDETCSEVSR